MDKEKNYSVPLSSLLKERRKHKETKQQLENLQSSLCRNKIIESISQSKKPIVDIVSYISSIASKLP